MLVTETVWCTTDPGVVVLTPAAVADGESGDPDLDGRDACRVRAPAGQVLPGALEVATVVSVRSPGSGLRTVTDAVRVTEPPTARSPVQTRERPLVERDTAR